MRKLSILTTLLAICLAGSISQPADAQIWNGPASSIRSGSTNPARCSPAGLNIFYNTTSGLVTCVTTDSWGLLSSGGVTVAHGATFTTYRPAADTDAARAAAVTAAFAASLAGDTISLSGGGHSLTSTLTILDYQTVILNGTYLYNTTNTADIFTVASKTDWSILGSGRIAGQGIGTGGVIADQAGVRVSGSAANNGRWSIDGALYFSDFKGAAIALQSTADTPHVGGRIHGVDIRNSRYGIYVGPAHEYLNGATFQIIGCTTGLYAEGGNFSFVNYNINDCDTGVHLKNNGNSGHGTFGVGNINHSVTTAINLESLTIGTDFVGVHVYGNAPIIFNACQGVKFSDGELQTPITMTGTFTGYNWLIDNWFQNSNTGPNITATAAQRPWLRMPHNFAGTNKTSISDEEVRGQKTLTESSATAFVQISVPSGGVVGGEIEYTIEANDATDYQNRTGIIPFAMVNKAGTETATLGTVGAATEVVAVSAGTLTNTLAADTSPTNAVNITANAVSSLTQTTLRITYTVRITWGTGTVTPQ